MPLAGLELGFTSWLLLILAGAFLGLDAVSWPQVMISRPLVSGTVGGLFFGDAAAGFLVGAWLELLSLRHPPYGAARYPDTGPAGLVAGGGYAAAGGSGFLPLLAAVLCGWAVGWTGSRSMQLIRWLNGRLVGDPETLASRPDRLRRRHRWAVRLDGLRAAAVTMAFLIPVALVVRFAAGFGEGPGDGGAMAAAGAGLGLIVGSGGRSLGPVRRALPLLLLGGACAWGLWA